MFKILAGYNNYEPMFIFHPFIVKERGTIWWNGICIAGMPPGSLEGWVKETRGWLY